MYHDTTPIQVRVPSLFFKVACGIVFSHTIGFTQKPLRSPWTPLVEEAPVRIEIVIAESDEESELIVAFFLDLAPDRLKLVCDGIRYPTSCRRCTALHLKTTLKV